MKVSFVGKITAFFGRLSKREKIIFIFAASLVGIFVGDRAVIQPIVGSFSSRSEEINELEKDIQKSIRLIAQKDKMLAERERFEPYLVESGSIDEETQALLKHTEELANESGVTLLYVKPSGRQRDKDRTILVSLECEGRIAELVNFFYEIKHSALLLKIDKYALQPVTRGSSVIKCAATISKTLI